MVYMNAKIFVFFTLLVAINSSIGNAQIYAGQSSGSDIFYYDFSPDTSLTAIDNQNSACNLDLNGDNIIDFRIYLWHSGSPAGWQHFMSIVSKNNNQVALSPVEVGYADTLSYGNNIDATNLWSSSDSIQLGGFFHIIVINDTTYYYGTWGPLYWHPGYLGVRIISSLDTLYGYIHLDIHDAKIKDYGINISAQAIDELYNSGSTISYPNPFSKKVTFESTSNDLVSLFIYDAFLKLILHKTFIGTTTINTEGFTKGVYFYELKNKNIVIKKGKLIRQ